MALNATRFGVISLLVCSCVLVVNTYKACEIHLFSNCVKRFLNVYKQDEDLSLKEIYCNAYKALAQCLTSHLQCVGELIDVFRFLILQHMILDNKLDVCSHTDLLLFKQVVKANQNYRMKIAGMKEIEPDNFEPCAAQTNYKCALHMAKALRKDNTNFCHVLHNFFTCYERHPCEDQIYKDFLANIEKVAKKLIRKLPIPGKC